MVHYHIVCKSKSFHYPEIVAVALEDLREELVKLVQLMYDTVGFIIDGVAYPPSKRYEAGGCQIKEWTPDRATFLDGSVVEICLCTKDCIEQLDAAYSNEDYWPENSIARDVIYEGR